MEKSKFLEPLVLGWIIFLVSFGHQASFYPLRVGLSYEDGFRAQKSNLSHESHPARISPGPVLFTNSKFHAQVGTSPFHTVSIQTFERKIRREGWFCNNKHFQIKSAMQFFADFLHTFCTALFALPYQKIHQYNSLWLAASEKWTPMSLGRYN